MEEEDDFKQYDIRDGIIFLIELNSDMFTPVKELNDKSQLFEILASIDELLQQLIITLPNTGVGIYLSNCDNSKTYNLTKIFGLYDLSSTKMKVLHDIVTDELEKRVRLKDSYKIGNGNETNLPKNLNKILDVFNQAKHYKSKKLMWFTNNDEPYTAKQTRDALYRVIGDYDEANIRINPVFLNRPNHTFNLKPYQEIFTTTNFLSNYKFNSAILSDKIKDSVLRLKELKRIQFATNLILSDGELGGNLGCSIKGYTLYNHEKLKKFKNLYYHENELKLVETESTLTDQQGNVLELPTDSEKPLKDQKAEAGLRNGLELNNDGENKIFHLGDQQWQFLRNYTFDHNPDSSTNTAIKDEVDNLDDSDDQLYIDTTLPGYLKLLGFRHIEHFKPFYNISSPAFITGDFLDGKNFEFGYKNSIKLFSALYKSCIKLERFAIVFGCIKRTSLPNLYAMYPTNLARSTKSPTINFPQGFLLIRLPWLDDIRSLPEWFINTKAKFDFYNSLPNPRDLVDNFSQIIEKCLWQDYNPQEYPNPNINFFYKILKYDLLQIPYSEEEMTLKNNDITYTLVKQLQDKLSSEELGKLVQALAQLLHKFEAFDQIQESSVPNKKRKVDTIDEEQVMVAWKTDSLNTFTMAQLRQFSEKYKSHIKPASKKQDLINNIKQFLDSRLV